MSLNGLSPYGYSSYGANSYAVPNNSQTSFQSALTPSFAGEQTVTAPAATEKKDNTGKILLGLGAAAAAVATGIVAYKTGKGGKVIDTIKKGLGTIKDKGSEIIAKAKNKLGKNTAVETAKDTIVSVKDMVASDADLAAKYGPNMSLAGYFHKLP